MLRKNWKVVRISWRRDPLLEKSLDHRISELHTEPTCRGKIRSMEGAFALLTELVCGEYYETQLYLEKRRQAEDHDRLRHAAGDHPTGCGDKALPGVF